MLFISNSAHIENVLGYDALMTGCVLVRALAAIDVKAGSSSTLFAVQQYGPGTDDDEQPRGDG